MLKKGNILFYIIMFLVSFVFLLGMTQVPRKKVSVEVLKNGHFRLKVDGRPFIVKGVCYNPISIGKTHDYNFWGDPLEPWKKDGEMMKKMGINTVRFYQPGEDLEEVKKVVADLYSNYGVRTMMGTWLKFWNYPAPFYDDEDFRRSVKQEVLAMVEALKDEDGILFWVLGNENNFSFSGKINPWSSDRLDAIKDPRQRLREKAGVYYSLINELAREIHEIDPNHPVVMGNGELAYLDVANEAAPDVDIVGCVIYRGKTFGNIFSSLKKMYDKPIVFIEFGCDAYNAHEKREDEDMQAFFIESQWAEIYKNLANNPNGEGNCLGGVMFEWSDEWWKHNDYDSNAWSIHDTESNWSNGSYYLDIKAERNMNMNEEWFGIVSLRKNENGLDERVPRKSYYAIRKFWHSPHDGKNLKYVK
ncbi:MAG: hypothetical protein ABIC68_03095 [Candidatus Omnitrophota bacterium]